MKELNKFLYSHRQCCKFRVTTHIDYKTKKLISITFRYYTIIAIYDLISNSFIRDYL
jgi:hypothetical protein